MNVEAVIALCSLGVAIVVALMAGRRDSRASAADQAQTMAKLDSICAGVDDIRVEQRAMRERVDGMSEKLASVESSTHSAHHRLDALEQRLNQHGQHCEL